jgi:hypothetical protein
MDIHQNKKGWPMRAILDLEAAPGFEPGNRGFADRCLTTWLCRLKKCLKCAKMPQVPKIERLKRLLQFPASEKMERETGFEPATSTLARLHSTAELFPLNFVIVNVF